MAQVSNTSPLELGELQKKVYANQTRAMEQDRALAAAKVVAKARRELLRRSGGTPQGVLKNLDLVLDSLEPRLISQLRASRLLETGYRQGNALLNEVAGPLGDQVTGIASTLDLNSLGLAVDSIGSVGKITGITQATKNKIKGALDISLALGEGTSQAMDRVFGTRGMPRDQPFRVAKIKAERIARTVTNELVNEGKTLAYKAFAETNPQLNTVNEWVNVSDFRTSDTCMALVGQRRAPGEAFVGGGFQGLRPPAHINCRSTIIPVILGRLDQVPAPVPVPVAPLPVQLKPLPPVAGEYRNPKLQIERMTVDGAAYGRGAGDIRVNGLGGVPEDVGNSRIFQGRRVAKDILAGAGSEVADSHDLMTHLSQAKAITLGSDDYSNQVHFDLKTIYGVASEAQKNLWSEEWDSPVDRFTGATREVVQDLANRKSQREAALEQEALARIEARRQTPVAEPEPDYGMMDFDIGDFDDFIGEIPEDTSDSLNDFLSGGLDDLESLLGLGGGTAYYVRESKHRTRGPETVKTPEYKNLLDSLPPDKREYWELLNYDNNEKATEPDEKQALRQWQKTVVDSHDKSALKGLVIPKTRTDIPRVVQDIKGHRIVVTYIRGTPPIHQSIGFSVDGRLSPPEGISHREAVGIALGTGKLLRAELAKMPDGTIVENGPIGGALGGRAAIYSRSGFGPTDHNGEQYGVIRGGKLYPLNIHDLEKIKETGEL